MKHSGVIGTCVVFLVSECIIVGAVSWQWHHAPRDNRPSWVEQLRQFDAYHYEHIARTGYRYSPYGRSEVAFFPAWPLAGRIARRLTRLSPLATYLVLSNAFLLGALLAFRVYVAGPRLSGQPNTAFVAAPTSEVSQRRVIGYSLWAFALWPATFFFHMPYSEAMLVVVGILALYVMQQRWRLPWVAAIVGLATAVRPVGVALLLPLAWYTVECRDGWRSRLTNLAWVLPLGCWGLLAYMTFLQIEFGNPLCFANTQYYWRMRPDLGWWDKALSLTAGEPFWAIYVRGMPGYFGGFSNWSNVFGGMRFFNPLFFGGAAVLIGVGAYRRWLSRKEVLLSAGLLVIPYLTRAYEMCMESHARFAAVVFPVYIVLGHLLARLPRVLALGILGISAVFLAWFAAGYAASRPFF